MGKPNNVGDVTLLLNKWGDGDSEALSELIPKVYQHLRGLAGGYLRRENREITLQATALVNELYLQFEGKVIQFNDSDHFYRVAARMMRRLLTSAARARTALKRGEGLAETLGGGDDEPPSNPVLDLDGLISLEEALAGLEKRFPRLARIVELRVFMGFQNDEIAALLDISLATVKREWVQAKQRLYVSLTRSL